MPSLELRGRYVLREYWSDAELFRRLTAEEREIYMGLWMLADDKGWLPRDIDEIAAALYRYEDPDRRSDRVRSAIQKLVKMKKVTSRRCGCIEVPAVRHYPRPGNKSEVHFKSHHARHDRTSSDFDNDVQTSSISSPDLTYIQPNSNTDPARAHARGGAPTKIASDLPEALANAPWNRPRQDGS